MHDTMTERGITISETKPALVTGSGHSFTTTVTSEHVCNGKFQTPYTAHATQVVPTTDYNTGAAYPSLTGVASAGGQGTVVVWGFLEGGADSAAAAVRCMQGSIETLDENGAFVRPPQFPSIPNDVCPFAYQVLKHYAYATSVTFGTSDWATTGFTNAIVHIAQLPIQPQVS